MKKTHENYMSMLAATVTVLDKNQAIWVANTPFSALVKSIKTDITDVQAAQKGGGEVSTGATADKENAADAAITQAAKLSKLAQVYALENNDRTLHDQVHLTKTHLDRLDDLELTPALEAFYTKLTVQDTGIAAYGVTTAELDKLAALTAAFDAIKSAPRVIITERKTHNTNIPALVRHLRFTISKIDKLIYIWADSQPLFFSNYTNARIIIDLGGRHDKPGDPPKE